MGKVPNEIFIFTAFACHDQGASSLAYAPQHQLLISAGKKGDVCIFDVRQRTLRHRFQVGELKLSARAMNFDEHFFSLPRLTITQ